LKKSIYSLYDLQQLTVAANRRYLAFLSSLDDPSIAIKTVSRLSEKAQDAGRSYSGFNFFSEQDLHLFETVVRGENTIAGFRNADVRKHLPDKSPGQVSRMLKRLWTHDLIKKVGGTYKYVRHRARPDRDHHGLEGQGARPHPGARSRSGLTRRAAPHRLAAAFKVLPDRARTWGARD